MTPKRVRVAMSIPTADPNVKDPGTYGVHVGHAQTLYAGYKIAQQKRCPFHVRIDGCRKTFGGDLSVFVVDLVACLHFLGIAEFHLYWQRQGCYGRDFLRQHVTDNEARLIEFLHWEHATLS